jgi:hypothetical protein
MLSSSLLSSTPPPRSYFAGGADVAVTELVLTFPFVGDNRDFTDDEAFVGAAGFPDSSMSSTASGEAMLARISLRL